MAAPRNLAMMEVVELVVMMAAAQVWSNGIVRDLRQSAFQGMNELYGTAGDAPLNGEAQAPIEPMTPADATQ